MLEVHEYAKALCSGTLELLCPEMELLECPDYDRSLLKGCGVISASAEGRLSFRMHGTMPRPIPAPLEPSNAPGKFHDIEDHVLLRAVDDQGTEWRAGPLIIQLKHPSEFMGNIARELAAIACRRKRAVGEQSTVGIYVPQQDRLSFGDSTLEVASVNGTVIGECRTWDHQRCVIGETTVTFRQVDRHWLVVNASQKSPMLPAWPGLMCQAIEFVTARSAQPALVTRACKHFEDIHIHSGPFRQLRSFLPGPTDGVEFQSRDACWELLSKYFGYIWERQRTPLALLDELSAIRSGATMSLQTASLTLAVGIEALARELLPGSPVAVWNEGGTDQLCKHIEIWKGEESLKQRVLGLLRSKTEPRAVDSLYAWATKKNLPHSMIDAWKLLRNRKAHGTALEENQLLYDHYYTVVELLYRLIADTVRYEGALLETSKRTWGLPELYTSSVSPKNE